MSRTFSTHAVRNVQSLDGSWQLSMPIGSSQISIDQQSDVVTYDYAVPSVWENIRGRESYRGQAVASRTFTIDNAGPFRLVFKAVSHTATVYVDGEKVGSHHNAYTPFAIDLSHLEAGSHDLSLHISNEHGEISALHIPNDYYNYGGITRPCELQQLRSPLYIRYCHATPKMVDSHWQATLRTCIVNLSDKPIDAALTVEIADQSAAFDARSFAPGVTHIDGEIRCPDAKPWEPKTPNLYNIDATLADAEGNAIDDWRDRMGFREISVEGNRLFLNGRLMFLFGFNRHEDHADYGCALPLEAIRRDLDLIEDMGANAIRTCHYPNDERMLDLCDERGFLVWEENHARGLSEEQMRHSKFREQCATCIDEMINWHYNHPSIVLWGILNECASESEYGRSCYAEQFEQVEALDQSRPTTYASCKHNTDICQDLPDVCGWNWYLNWYTTEDSTHTLQDRLDWLATTPAKGKPMIASEFGGGAIPGVRDPFRQAKWSEERQVKILEADLKEYLDPERFAGAFIWQFCDCRVHENMFSKRPRTMNNKGVVNERRQPKLSYGLVRSRFDEFAAKLAAMDAV